MQSRGFSNPTAPTRWSEEDRHPLLVVSSDGRTLTLPEWSGTVDMASTARSDRPVPPSSDLCYFEVEIIHRGLQGHIGIGFTAKDVSLARLPGWDARSWGYHGDDGRTFADQRTGSAYGPTFTAGDIIGCGIDLKHGKAFYTKNGRYLGVAFESLGGLGGPGSELYPTVGMRSRDESVRANFGQQPFQFDLAAHLEGGDGALLAPQPEVL